MHTYWKPFSRNSEAREARTLPGVTLCSVYGAALLQFVFPQIPWNFGYLFFKRGKESFAPNGFAQICTGSFVVTKLWYGMRVDISTWSVSLLLLKFILHVALYLPVITFLHHYSFLFLAVFISNFNTIIPLLYLCYWFLCCVICPIDLSGLLVKKNVE